MQTDQLIPVTIFCESHHIEASFIQALNSTGLVEFIIIEEHSYVPAEQLETLEKIVRLHFEMGINVEGIETITHLLQRIHGLQQELTDVKNRLRLYEAS